MLKRFYIYLLLGIGIVLSIANSTFAVDSCNFNDENAITEDEYVSLEEQHVFEADDVMEITSGTMTYESQTIRAIVNNFTLTNAGTIRATDTIAINSTGNIATINNSGTIIATNDYAIKGYGDTFNLTNSDSGTIQATAYGLHATGDYGIVSNSGKIYGTTKIAILVNGEGHKITNQSGGLIRVGTSVSTESAHKLAVQAGGSGNDLILENYELFFVK